MATPLNFQLRTLLWYTHRDKTRVHMPAKNISSIESKMLISCLWAPLLVLTQRKETVFWSNFVFFYN